MKSAQIRSFFWSAGSPNAGKCRPEKTPYLGTFYAVGIKMNALNFNAVRFVANLIKIEKFDTQIIALKFNSAMLEKSSE